MLIRIFQIRITITQIEAMNIITRAKGIIIMIKIITKKTRMNIMRRLYINKNTIKIIIDIIASLIQPTPFSISNF